MLGVREREMSDYSLGLVEDPQELTVSAVQAAEVVGVPVTRIRGWARNGRLRAVGREAAGARGRRVQVYRLSDVFAVERHERRRSSTA
jgi:hypothetical protein